MSNEVQETPLQKILVIENDLDILMMVEDMLRGEGYHVDVLRNGIQTHLRVPQKTYDVVILDMGLSDFSERAVQHAFSAFHPSVPIIVHTRETSLEFKQHCIDAGAFAFFTKPCNLDELKKAVREAVASGLGNQE